MEELAIFGGNPVRKDPIYYGRQCIGKDDVEAVIETLTSDYITCGPKVDEAEKMLCEATGAKRAVVVSNGTAALHLSALAAGFQKGDEVIVSPITFAASANCILYCGAKPVFADIDPDTYNIDPDCIRKSITDKTKGIVAVDFTGQAVRLNEIREICKEHGLYLIEDAAHSLGTTYNGKPVGSLADLTCFSFHPVKTVTSGEGGAITTNNEELYKRIMRLRAHGITRHRDEMVHPSDALWYNEQVELGFNYRLTDIQAALLVSQLRKLPDFSRRRREITAMYDAAFSEMPEIIVQKEIAESKTTRHLYVIRLNTELLKCDRRAFFDALYAENTRPQVHYLPVYMHSYYESLGYKKGICPNAERYYETSMSIPLYPSLTDEDVQDVIRAVKKVTAYYRK